MRARSTRSVPTVTGTGRTPCAPAACTRRRFERDHDRARARRVRLSARAAAVPHTAPPPDPRTPLPAHIACRPWSYDDREAIGCFVVCPEDGLRQSFGTAHAVAHAACVEHNAIHHPDARRSRSRLLSLIYESRAAPGFDAEALRALLLESRSHNSAFGVTGILLAEQDWFLQALEGPEAIVERLMHGIERDPRHVHVRVLSREYRQVRRFPDWAMAEGHIGEALALPLARYYEAMLAARGSIAG